LVELEKINGVHTKPQQTGIYRIAQIRSAEILRRYLRSDEHAVAHSANCLTDHGFRSIRLRCVNQNSAALEASP
jgi:hypothetical protein